MESINISGTSKSTREVLQDLRMQRQGDKASEETDGSSEESDVEDVDDLGEKKAKRRRCISSWNIFMRKQSVIS